MEREARKDRVRLGREREREREEEKILTSDLGRVELWDYECRDRASPKSK